MPSLLTGAATSEAKAQACLYVAIATLVIGFTGGMLVAWQLWHPRPAPPEKHAAAVQLPKSGAIAIERNQAAPVPAKIVAAAKELNPKGKLTRASTLTVQPKQAGCDPVDVDLGLVKLPDNTSRIVASADKATITGGIDIPTATEQVVREMKWAAGASYDVRERSYGVFVDRDFGPLRVSAEIRQSQVQGATAIVRAGIRF